MCPLSGVHPRPAAAADGWRQRPPRPAGSRSQPGFAPGRNAGRTRVRVVTVVGARPQFIKAAPVSAALARAGYRELLVHTGQHYDYAMSQVFFDELGIPAPAINLEIGSA